jgi:hypothetical protein
MLGNVEASQGDLARAASTGSRSPVALCPESVEGTPAAGESAFRGATGSDMGSGRLIGSTQLLARRPFAERCAQSISDLAAACEIA